MERDWNVGELLSVSSAYWRGCALQAAVRLDLFTIVQGSSLEQDKIAKKAQTDSRATGLLLDALAAMKLLQKDDSGYRNTPFAEKFLVKTSAQYMGHIILHHHHLLDGWSQLDSAVSSGKPVEKRSYGAEVERESFLMGMFNLGMGLAPQIAEQIELSGRKKLLDLGGGPGTYAIHFCGANNELAATIFDRPTTKPFAEKTIAAFNLEKRINFASGDFLEDPISGGPYDVVWISHILHSFSEAECLILLKKAIAQMSKGALLLIHDFILDDSKDGPEFAALFSLNMLINNSKGRSYSGEEIGSMMQEAGFSDIKLHSFKSPNGSSVIIGVV